MRQAKVVMVTLALLVLVAVAAQAEMYVEAYAGGNFAASSANSASAFFPTFAPPSPGVYSNPGKIDPAFQGGLKIGTWFVKEGFMGFNYPEWMKYLGFFLDFSYHRLNFVNNFGLLVAPGGPYRMHNKTEGAVATLAFMFAARYGFFPDSEVPFGRLQPYVAVGPAIMFSWQNPSVAFDAGARIDPDSKSSIDLALAAEAGFRWMALKNVSLDVSFKYRFTQPSYAYYHAQSSGIIQNDYFLKPDYHFFSFQVGAAYHF
ncbi:MAG: hypothetical protein A2Y80_00180 [Deltaproteobacteria bacterium RBG_13_58_19]|nr:MAG: hypothetical protein A2Y80_00180 [Deltaproteobacteria bacterium RBG_13_58_19]